MLTIQSGISNITKKPAFGNYGNIAYAYEDENVNSPEPHYMKHISNGERCIPMYPKDEIEISRVNAMPDEDIEDIDDAELIKQKLKEEENQYDDDKNFWQEQKETFEDLANDAEVPGLIKKPMKWISVVISSILGGMAMVWGTKKSMGAVETLAKTQKVKSISSSFNKSAIGKSTIVSGIRKKYNRLTSKINTEKAKNYTANTMGVSGGITSGVTAAKEADKEEKKDAK